MKQFQILTVLVLAGSCLVQSNAQTTEDYSKCADGSDLFFPPECPNVDPGLPVYFPFPYDCTQYFECTNGIARCIKCAPGTVWDQELSVCNHPSAVNCTIITTPVPTTTTTTSTTTSTTTTTTTTTTTEEPTTTTEEPTTTTEEPTTTTEEPTTTTTTTTTEDPINWICPEQYAGLIRHPFDCTKFYNCDPARRPCLFDCPSNLYFNPAIAACDHRYNVPDCVGGVPPPTSTTTASGGVGSSLNYRNVNRLDVAQNVQFVANLLKKDSVVGFSDSDPCEVIRMNLEM